MIYRLPTSLFSTGDRENFSRSKDAVQGFLFVVQGEKYCLENEEENFQRSEPALKFSETKRTKSSCVSKVGAHKKFCAAHARSK